MRADLAAVLNRKKVQEISDPAERIAQLRVAVERAEEIGDMTVFLAALGAYEAACLANPAPSAWPGPNWNLRIVCSEKTGSTPSN